MDDNIHMFAVFKQLVKVSMLIANIGEVHEARRINVITPENLCYLQECHMNKYIENLDEESQQYVRRNKSKFDFWVHDMVLHGKKSNGAAVGTYPVNLEPTSVAAKNKNPPIGSIQFRAPGISTLQQRTIPEFDDNSSLLSKKSIHSLGTKGTTTRLHFKVEIPELQVMHQQEKEVMNGALKVFNQLFLCVNGNGRLTGKCRARTSNKKNEVTQTFKCTCDTGIQFKFVHNWNFDVLEDREKKVLVCKAFAVKDNDHIVRNHFILKSGKLTTGPSEERATDSGLTTGSGYSFMAACNVPVEQVVEEIEGVPNGTSFLKRKMLCEKVIPSTMHDASYNQSVKKANVVKEQRKLPPSRSTGVEVAGTKIATASIPTCLGETICTRQRLASLKGVQKPVRETVTTAEKMAQSLEGSKPKKNIPVGEFNINLEEEKDITHRNLFTTEKVYKVGCLKQTRKSASRKSLGTRRRSKIALTVGKRSGSEISDDTLDKGIVASKPLKITYTGFGISGHSNEHDSFSFDGKCTV